VSIYDRLLSFRPKTNQINASLGGQGSLSVNGKTGAWMTLHGVLVLA
jgi:hypothetical protein